MSHSSPTSIVACTCLLGLFLFGGPSGPVALGAPADPTAEEATGPELKQGVLATTEALDDAVGKARLVLQGLESVKGTYAQFRKREDLERKVREVKEAVAMVNTTLPAAKATAERIDAMSPTERKATFGRDASDVETYAWIIGDRLETWGKARAAWVRAVNDAAREDLDQARAMLGAPDTKDAALGHMEMWVIGYHGTMLEAVPALLEGASAVLPATAAEVAEKERTARLEQEVEAMAAEVRAIREAIEAAHRARVAQARFPKGSAPGDPSIVKVLEAEFGPVLKAAVHSPWFERHETYWRNGRWYAQTKRYSNVWIAARSESGRTWVYLTQVQATKQGASWGPVSYRGVSDSFEMLPENLVP